MNETITRSAGASHGQEFNPKQMLQNEKKIMGSKYCTKQDVIDSLELVARGEVWPIVTEKYSLDEVEKVHERLEKGLITGRAAIVMQ